MSFATKIAASGKSPVYILEFDGDSLDETEYDSVANWSAGTNVGNLAADTGEAIEGTGSIGWDKTGTASVEAAITNASIASFDFADYAYLTLRVKMPTTEAGAPNHLHVELGQDSSNRWLWTIPAAFFTEGEWTTLRLSLNEYDSGYTGTLTTVGSPTTAGVVWTRMNFRGTSSAYTHSGARVDALRGHPWRYSTNKVTDLRADTKQGWMEFPNITPHFYDPRRGTLSNANASCRVTDADGSTVINDMGDFAMLRRGATILMGFLGDSETDTNFEPIFRGIVDKTPHGGEAWTFQIGDNLRRFKVPFAQDATDASPYTIGSDNIIDICLALATSTGNGNNNIGLAANYDTETAARGAGIPSELFDATFETNRDDWMGQDTGTFTFREPENSFFDWFLREVCLGYGVMPVVLGDGKLSLRAVEEGVYPKSSPPVFGTSVIKSIMPKFSQESERVKNQVRVLYDYDSVDDEFDTDSADTYKLQASIDRYGVQQLTIKSKGITDAAVAARVANRYLYMLGEGAPPVQLKTFATQQPRENGELVHLTVPRTFPDLDAKTYGIITKLAQIEGRGFNPATGDCEFALGVTSYNLGNYRLISAFAFDYDTATAAQAAVYGWISDGSDLLGTANDPTHVIGPG